MLTLALTLALTSEGGASCGGECSTWYRFTLERTAGAGA
jgi:hypothetical protein